MNEKTVSWQSGSTAFHLGAKMESLKALAKGHHQVMIVDETVLRLHGHRLPRIPVIPVVSNETEKSLETARKIYNQLTDMKADRNTLIWCVGGGITTDIGGFSASTYMRGLPFILVPTTLLGQVDAAIGGKCGVNFKGFKNLVGTFSHPTDVVVDYEFLKTLPEEEFRNGLAEMVKHACIADKTLFERLESLYELPKQLKSRQKEALSLIEQSIPIKINIVVQDEREGGRRKLLNFGHTFGHAIEATTGIPHGHAVSIGMVMAAQLSVELDMLEDTETDRLIRLLSRYNLPVKLPVLPELLQKALWHDKKKNNDLIDMVVLTEIGKAELTPISIQKLKEFLYDLRQYQ
ncbi:MAG: 3-dehydroquinate synthase [Acidobacteria bacterium]|nr:3-dehydroquinate synthase [Acidobacteriota bacterium]